MRIIIFIVSSIAIMVIFGCGGHKYASYEPSSANKDGVARYHGNSVGLFSKIPTPNETATAERINAEAYAIKKQADTEAIMVANMQNGNILRSEQLVMAFVNHDDSRTYWVYDPQNIRRKIMLRPGSGFGHYATTKIPSEVTIYWNGGQKKIPVEKSKIYKRPINGIEADWVLIINFYQ